MTIIKHGDIQERVRFVCENCGCEWKAQEIEAEQAVYCMEKHKTLYFMDCPECGKIRVEGEKGNKP
jgi:transposase-like protein